MPSSDREMHLKSSAGRPKGTCKTAVLPLSSADLVWESGNMAAQTAFNGHVESPTENGYTFSASPLYESKPRL